MQRYIGKKYFILLDIYVEQFLYHLTIKVLLINHHYKFNRLMMLSVDKNR